MTKYPARLLLPLLLLGWTLAIAQPAGWTVNSAQYQYSMTAVAQISVNGTPSHLLNNYLAVYVQGQLRGWAAPVKFNGQAYYFLNLYANVYKDEVLYFRAFIGADQKMYEAASTTLFKHHKALGTIAAPYQIDLTLGQRPLIYSLSEVNYAEGTCNNVLDVQASDNLNTEGNGLMYSIVGGADATRFYIHPQSGLLSWKSGFTPDFEAPADADGNNRYEVRVEVKDAAGLKDEQAITVTVVKSVPPLPLICPPSLSVETSDDGMGNCTATALGLSIPSPTLCASYSLAYQLSGATVGNGTGPLPFNQAFGKGVTTVAYTRTGAGAGQCSFTVTVSDVEPPSITCPANIAKNTDPNLCTAIVTYAVIGGDNCSYTLTRTSAANTASGSAFLKGTTTVSWKVTDAANLSTDCSFTVTVTDAQMPSVTCPANIVRNTDANLCSASVTYATPTASDNCTPAPTVAWVSGPAAAPTPSGLNSISTFPKGITSVIWEATDGVGLTKRCTFTVTVNDLQKPTIACPANKTQGTDPGFCSALVTYTTPTASDNCNPAPTVMHVSGGTGHVTGSPNSSATFQKGVTTVTWKATDEAGNTKTCTFKITVNDLEKPMMTCLTDINANNDAGLCSAVVTYTLPTFTDNCPPTSGQSVKISGPASGSAFSVGTSNVVYRATDASGNTKQCTLKVIVTDNQPPTIGCPGPIVVTGSGTPCKGVAVYANPTASDNCSGSLTPFLLSGLASGSQFPAGVTTNTWRAIAGNGQSADCAFMVTVECPMNAPGSPAGGESGMEDSEWGGSSQDRIPQVSETWRVSEHVPEQALSIRLYPNPNVGTFTVEMLGKADGDGEVEFALYDALGQWAKREQADFRSGNLVQVFQYGELPAGLYTLAIQNGKEVKFAKVVIQR